MAFQKPPGTQDFLPGAVEKWQFVERMARDICRRFNFREIRTPMFEIDGIVQTRRRRNDGYRREGNVHVHGPR